MLLHPIKLKNESESSFRTINIPQREQGYDFFDSMAITSSEDFKAFIDEVSQHGYWNNRKPFIDGLLNAQVDFNREALVLLRHTEGSGSARVSLETPVLQEKTLLCEIRGELRTAGTADMAYHCFALAVSKALVDKVQLTSIPSWAGEPARPTILLSTTERQPLAVRHYPPSPKPSSSECPKLILGCPTDLLETGKTYVVSLLIEGGSPKGELIYAWSVSGAEIVEGQGTRSLKIRINQPNQIVKAFVELGGINPYCERLATCSCGPTR